MIWTNTYTQGTTLPRGTKLKKKMKVIFICCVKADFPPSPSLKNIKVVFCREWLRVKMRSIAEWSEINYKKSGPSSRAICEWRASECQLSVHVMLFRNPVNEMLFLSDCNVSIHVYHTTAVFVPVKKCVKQGPTFSTLKMEKKKYFLKNI